ncbi:MAG TPA: hypothetical protein VGX76_11570, partial [Pirellulales bacterium]|nr:hypothetical protein [Pirellulales bacterium]
MQGDADARFFGRRDIDGQAENHRLAGEEERESQLDGAGVPSKSGRLALELAKARFRAADAYG